MIEDELRRAFARHEHLVPDAWALRPAIARAARRGLRRRRVRRAGLTSAGAAVLVVLALLAPGVARSWWGPATTLALPLSPPWSSGAVKPRIGPPLNILIAGTDDGSLAPGSTVGDAADTVIVVHVPADRSALYLIAIERDTLVDDGAGRPQLKLSEAYTKGGFPRLLAGVTGLTGLHIDAGAKIGLAGLTSVTDALGGVDLCVDIKTTSVQTGQTWAPGCYHFSGAQAADYLRQRYYAGAPADPGLSGGFIRQRHQIEYLQAVLSQLGRHGVLIDPALLSTLVTAAHGSLVIDAGTNSVTDLITTVRPALAQVVGVTVPELNQARPGKDPGLSISDDGRSLFAAVAADQVDRWLAAHPSAVTPSK